MAMMEILHFLSILILFQIITIIISPTSHATRHAPQTHVQNLSPFDFVKDLEGCQKGNATKGLAQLKNYLHRFGYLANPHDDDVFDGDLESAIRIYQQNYHITPTGTLDAATVERMVSPRCGDPDIINGVNTMQRNNTHAHTYGKSIHNVAHFSFFPNRNRWDKTSLTYGFLPNTPPAAMSAVANAFGKWASATQFSFSQADVSGGDEPDMVVGFFKGDHGDGAAFDGPGGTVAHAFRPPDGRFHLDVDETWGIDVNPTTLHLESVALHEIGHLLGLGHTNVPTAAMFPTIRKGERLTLHQDDIEGIRVLYDI